MAEANTATVEIAEDDTVIVDVTDQPDLAAEDEAVVEPKPAVAKPAKSAAAKPSAADEAAAALTKSLETETSRRTAAEATANAERIRADAAERGRQAATTEAQSLREQAENQELTIITTGIEGATREIAAQQAELERAQEAGEFAKASAAQVKLAKAAAALDRLEDAKANYEAGTRKAPLTEGRVEAQPTQVSAFEQYVSGFAPPAQAWLRAHPDCIPPSIPGGDAVKNAKMMKGHYAALEQNIQPNTPEYFRIIEETAGYRAPVSAAAEVVQAGAEEPVVAPKPKPRQVQVAAPVSRDPPSANGARTTRSVTLSKDQQDAAKTSFPHLAPQQAFAQYARNLIELEAEGKMGRTTH